MPISYLIRSGTVVTPTRVFKGSVLVEGGKIASVAEGDDVSPPRGAQVIDASGSLVLPGFIDMHVHGGGGADAMDGTYEAVNAMSIAHARGGTTSMVPATVSAPAEDMMRALDAIREAVRRGVDGARVLGAHLEGPYISKEQRGAQDERYIREPSDDEVAELFNRDELRVVSAAPEVPGGLDLARKLSRKGVVMSIGHSDATIYEVERAVEAGYSHVTHLYSGCSTVRRIRAYRYPGVVEAALLLDDLSVDIIADGKHLPPHLIRLIIKSKGIKGVSAITDAMRAAGMPPGRYRLGEQEVVVDEGVAWLQDRSAFAGSVSTMDRMFEVLVSEVGVGVSEAAAMLSTNPASVLGLRRKGRIAEGYDADITVMKGFRAILTMSEGRVIYSAGGKDHSA
ncbi:MAG: N-acetylglucosamine-6-phosphate deacetylase [Thermoprotei archaeon]